MGQFSVEKPVAPGSVLSGNQQSAGRSPLVVTSRGPTDGSVAKFREKLSRWEWIPLRSMDA
jgi:hypothetical protein